MSSPQAQNWLVAASNSSIRQGQRYPNGQLIRRRDDFSSPVITQRARERYFEDGDINPISLSEITRLHSWRQYRRDRAIDRAEPQRKAWPTLYRGQSRGRRGVIAASTLARSVPDGYTIMMAALPQIAILPAMKHTDYKPLESFAPITNVASNPFCLVVNPQFEPKTLKDLIAYVKARPGKVPYASGGTGSLSHLAMVLLCERAGLNMVHVPYKGGAPAIADVIGNQIPMYFANLSEAMPHVGHDVRPLAVSGTKRVGKLPDVPTVAESGYPDFRAETWNGLIAPAKTPTSVIDVVAAETKNALKDPTILERFAAYGVEPIGSTPVEFERTMAEDVAQWGETVRAAGIRL